ncbi:MAG: hypothetical protein AAGG51_29560 [Cyanobacteria bacterium P01_G01_bin.54]
MSIASPDIIVVNSDGEYLIVVEAKLNSSSHQRAIEQLKHFMASVGCTFGLAVTGEQISLLRDSFEKFHGESITVIGRARLPKHLLPPADGRWKENPYYEFESQVQRWLEGLKLTPRLDILPNDLKELFEEPIISLLQFGEIRAAGPRWSRVVS